MLGLRGLLSLGAHRMRFADSGLAAMLIPVSAGLLLAGCQVPQTQKTAGPAPIVSEASSSPQALEQALEPDAPQALPKQTPLAATPAVARAQDDHDALPAALRLSGDPEELLGLDHSSLRRALGDPKRVRHEFTAQVWQYVTGECVVDLYLYDQDGGLKVTYVEARSRTADQTPTTRCLKSLIERPTASVR